MGTIVTGPGSPLTISSGSGQKIYAYNTIGTAAIRVAPANASRQSITFHNPGTIDIFIAPQYIQTTGSDVLFNPTTVALGGCFLLYANGGTITFTGECQKPWLAFSASGANNPLTTMESNA